LPSEAIISFDGACSGNPGPGGGGAHVEIKGRNGIHVHRGLPTTTNNEAEYTGLIIGLHYALLEGIEDVEIRGDSRLVIEQVSGSWECRAANLQPLLREVQRLLSCFTSYRLKWIPRLLNKEADAASRGHATYEMTPIIAGDAREQVGWNLRRLDRPAS
jgi:ribonuclease HI